MPGLRERLAQKGIHYDLRRIRAGGGRGAGGVSPHPLLSVVHNDTVVNAPVRGAMVLADSTPEWSILLHPGAPGYALVPDATDVAWDLTPIWGGDHTWDDGIGDSPANHFITQSNDQFSMWAENDATPGNSDFIVKFPFYDTDTQFIWRDSLDVDVAYVDADGNAWLEGNLLLTDDAEAGIPAGGRFVFDTTPAPDQIDVNSADLNFVTAAHGIIHVDGVAAGMVLLADGTRYVPATASITVPIAPGGRGHIIRADAVPAWTSYDASTLGAILIGDGNDIISDTTPSIAGLVTLGDGWVNTAGTGDLNGTDLLIDADGDSYLHESADDVVDLVLAGASGEFGITINGAEDFTFTANSLNILAGSFVTMADDTGIGLGAAAGRITFDNQAPDQLEIQDAILILNAVTTDAAFIAILYAMDGNIGVSQDGNPAAVHAFGYGVAGTDYGVFRARYAGTSRAFATAAQAGDILGRYGMGGFGATGFIATSTAWMQAIAAENFTDAAMGTHLEFYTAPTGSLVAAERMRITASGRVKIGGTAGASAQLDVDQDDNAAAIAVLRLEQDDTNQPFIRFEGTAANGVVARSIVDYPDGTGTEEAWLMINIQDLGNQVPDGTYYLLAYEVT